VPPGHWLTRPLLYFQQKRDERELRERRCEGKRKHMGQRDWEQASTPNTSGVVGGGWVHFSETEA